MPLVPVLFGTALVLSLWYGLQLTHRPVTALRSSVKIGATLGLVALAVILSAPVLVLAGLVAGTIGDGFLSRDRDSGFLPGLAAFLAGHLCYAWFFASRSASLWPDAWQVWQWAAMALAIAAAALLLRRLWPVIGKLRLPVTAYVMVSLALVWAAICAPAELGLARIGVGLFVTSDVILAMQLFLIPADSPASRPAATGLWLLYWFGQAAILFGVVEA